MKRDFYFRLLIVLMAFSQFNLSKAQDSNDSPQHRVIISTDIGGTDPDDFQSMVHLLVYADTFDIEGLISSPHGDGRASHILECIAKYEQDYPKLLSYSDKYPTPDSLRKLVKQGETEIVSPIGFRDPTEGSEWIIECAKRDDPRPLHILVWGGIEDLAQALHDAPEILPKLRVYWIGGPNKKWSVNAYQYIAENFPDLWIIESNATYRGWFTGGDQSGTWGNSSFVQTYVKGFGALGDYFYSKKSSLKMGDTPSLMRLYYGDAEDPGQESWGGQFVRAWERPHKIFRRLTTESDNIEEFGVLELRLPFDSAGLTNPVATMDIDRDIAGFVMGDTVKFLFSPKKAGSFDYTIISNIPSLNGKTGTIISTATPASNKDNPSSSIPNWWADDPSPEVKDDGHIGAKTVNKWRIDYLSDFADRMYRCKYFANTYFNLNTTATNGTIIRDPNDSAYLVGSIVTLTAVPADGYVFTSWGGDASGTSATIDVTMDSDKNITAQFDKISDISNISHEKISVYPTHFKNVVKISNFDRSNEHLYVELYDISGRKVNNYKLKAEQGDVSVNLNDLMPGTYIFRISYGSEYCTKTLIKSKG